MTEQPETTAIENQPEAVKTPAKPAPAADDGALTPEQQRAFDKVISNRAKEAAEKARVALLKELGIENTDDPEAVTAAKAKLNKAKADEDAQKSELQKLVEQNARITADLEAEKKRASEVEARRIADKVDGRIEALATKSGALDPSDVSKWLRENRRDDVAAIVGDDEKIDDAKAGELIEAVRKAKAHWFAGAKGAGTGSHQSGTTPGMDDSAARDANFKRYRRNV